MGRGRGGHQACVGPVARIDQCSQHCSTRSVTDGHMPRACAIYHSVVYRPYPITHCDPITAQLCCWKRAATPLCTAL